MCACMCVRVCVGGRVGGSVGVVFSVNDIEGDWIERISVATCMSTAAEVIGARWELDRGYTGAT